MKLFQKIGGFALGLLLIWGLAFSNSFNKGDRAFKVFKLERGKHYTHTIDLGQEGKLKQLLQPGTFSVSYKLKLQEKANLKLKAEAQDLEVILSQGSKKGLWPPLDFNQTLKNNRAKYLKTQEEAERLSGEDIPLSLELKTVAAHKPVAGQLKLVLLQEGQEYATILLKVINSKAQR